MHVRCVLSWSKRQRGSQFPAWRQTYPDLPLPLRCLILLPLPYTCACLQARHRPGRPRLGHRAPWHARADLRRAGRGSRGPVRALCAEPLPGLRSEGDSPGCHGAGHLEDRAEVPARATGRWGRSGGDSCSAEVSAGTASVAFQHAQVRGFPPLAIKESCVWNTVGWLQPTLFPTQAATPCLAVASLLVDEVYGAFKSLAVSLKLAGGVCGSFLTAQIKGSRTHRLCLKQSKASTAFTGSQISAPASALGVGPLPPSLALFERPKTHRTDWGSKWHDGGLLPTFLI